MRTIFFPDDTGIRTNEKILKLTRVHKVCTYHQVLRCWITMHAQIRSVRLHTAQQRSVAPCGAVRCDAVCPSLPCCVVLRCVLYFEHRAVPGIIRIAVYYFSSFFFFYMHLVFHGPLFFSPRKVPPYCRNVTPVTKAHSAAEHNRAICSAQAALGIIKSLFAPNNGPLLSAPFTFFSCILPYLARA